MKNIALSFSGGGFRAAAYSLGCLSYLNHLKTGEGSMLERVSYISSTSGGSIANLVYSQHVYSGSTFASCYNFLKSKLSGDDLLSEALSLLSDDSKWAARPEKSRNIINAFSLVYKNLFNHFDNDSFGVFSNTENEPHIKEVCINATEFTNGLAFRFQSQNASLPKGYIGNNNINFKGSGIVNALAIKLSDILAASSCFPSGFEPVIFPRDFSNPQVSGKALTDGLSYTANEYTLDNYNHLSLLTDEEFKSEDIQFGLMDGGVADNQAIDAFTLADDRRKKNGLPTFDLFISCDVTSYLMDGYTLPVQKKHFMDFMSIRAILGLFVLAALWLPFMLVAYRGLWAPWHYITGTLSALPLAAILWYAASRITSLFVKKKPESTWNKTFKKHLGKFLKLSFGEVRQMLAARFKSVFILANDIYLKQIRRQYYEAIFESSKYRKRTIQNTIYDLSKAKFKDDADEGKKLELTPSQAIIETAEKARTMATTLWFDEHHTSAKTPEAIIATGQFTTCYNLIRYITNPNRKATDEEKALLPQLMEDWKLFCEKPDFLV